MKPPNIGGVTRQNNGLSTSTLSADGAERRRESSSEFSMQRRNQLAKAWTERKGDSNDARANEKAICSLIRYL